jgi:hypothetical protein
MKSLKESLDTFIERFYNNIPKMEKFNASLTEALEKLRNSDYETVAEFEKFLEHMLDCIYYEMVEEVIGMLNRKDGIKGIKWSYDDARSVIEKHQLKEKHGNFDCLVFWYALNKMHAVHYSPTRSAEFFIELAADEIAEFEDILEAEIKHKFGMAKGAK